MSKIGNICFPSIAILEVNASYTIKRNQTNIVDLWIQPIFFFMFHAYWKWLHRLKLWSQQWLRLLWFNLKRCVFEVCVDAVRHDNWFGTIGISRTLHSRVWCLHSQFILWTKFFLRMQNSSKNTSHGKFEINKLRQCILFIRILFLQFWIFSRKYFSGFLSL